MFRQKKSSRLLNTTKLSKINQSYLFYIRVTFFFQSQNNIMYPCNADRSSATVDSKSTISYIAPTPLAPGRLHQVVVIL